MLPDDQRDDDGFKVFGRRKAPLAPAVDDEEGFRVWGKAPTPPAKRAPPPTSHTAPTPPEQPDLEPAGALGTFASEYLSAGIYDPARALTRKATAGGKALGDIELETQGFLRSIGAHLKTDDFDFPSLEAIGKKAGDVDKILRAARLMQRISGENERLARQEAAGMGIKLDEYYAKKQAAEYQRLWGEDAKARGPFYEKMRAPTPAELAATEQREALPDFGGPPIGGAGAMVAPDQRIELGREVQAKSLVPGLTRAALTDDDVKAEVNSYIRAVASGGLEGWRKRNPVISTIGEYGSPMLSFVPAMGAASMFGRGLKAALGSFAPAVNPAVKTALTMAGADLLVQRGQQLTGARERVDLTQAFIAGVAGSAGGIVGDRVRKGLLQRRVSKLGLDVIEDLQAQLSGSGSADVAEASIKLATISEKANGILQRLAPNVANLGTYSLAANTLNNLISAMETSEQAIDGAPTGDERGLLASVAHEVLGAAAAGIAGALLHSRGEAWLRSAAPRFFSRGMAPADVAAASKVLEEAGKKLGAMVGEAEMATEYGVDPTRRMTLPEASKVVKERADPTKREAAQEPEFPDWKVYKTRRPAQGIGTPEGQAAPEVREPPAQVKPPVKPSAKATKAPAPDDPQAAPEPASQPPQPLQFGRDYVAAAEKKYGRESGAVSRARELERTEEWIKQKEALNNQIETREGGVRAKERDRKSLVVGRRELAEGRERLKTLRADMDEILSRPLEKVEPKKEPVVSRDRAEVEPVEKRETESVDKTVRPHEVKLEVAKGKADVEFKDSEGNVIASGARFTAKPEIKTESSRTVELERKKLTDPAEIERVGKSLGPGEYLKTDPKTGAVELVRTRTEKTTAKTGGFASGSAAERLRRFVKSVMETTRARAGMEGVKPGSKFETLEAERDALFGPTTYASGKAEPRPGAEAFTGLSKQQTADRINELNRLIESGYTHPHDFILRVKQEGAPDMVFRWQGASNRPGTSEVLATGLRQVSGKLETHRPGDVVETAKKVAKEAAAKAKKAPKTPAPKAEQPVPEKVKVVKSRAASLYAGSRVSKNGRITRLTGEQVQNVYHQIKSGDVKLVSARRTDRNGGVEVTLENGTTFKIHGGGDQIYKDLGDSLIRDAQKAGFVRLPFVMTPQERAIKEQQLVEAVDRLWEQHLPTWTLKGLGVIGNVLDKSITNVIPTLGKNLMGDEFNWQPNDPFMRQRIPDAFRRAMGWMVDPDLVKAKVEADRAIGPKMVRIQQLAGELDKLTSLPGGDELANDMFFALENRPTMRVEPGKPGRMSSAFAGGKVKKPVVKIAERPTSTKEVPIEAREYPPEMALRAAKIVEEMRSLFSEAGELLVKFKVLPEEVRETTTVNEETGEMEPARVMWFKGDPGKRVGKLVGGYKFYEGHYAPHTLDTNERRRLAMASTFAEHGRYAQALKLPVVDVGAVRAFQQTSGRRRTLTNEEWARIGGIRDVRATVPRLVTEMRAAQQLKLLDIIGQNKDWVSFDEPPSAKGFREEREKLEKETQKHIRLMVKNRYRFKYEHGTYLPSHLRGPEAIRSQQTRAEKKVMAQELMMKRAGLPEIGDLAGVDPKSAEGKELKKQQLRLRRLRQLSFSKIQSEIREDALSTKEHLANAKLKDLRGKLAALRQATSPWTELKGSWWGPLTDAGRKRAWMRSDIYGDVNSVHKQSSGWMRVFDTAITLLKKNVTSRNPITHINNSIGNIFLNEAAGLRLTPAGIEQYRLAKDAIKEFAANGKLKDSYLRELLESNEFGRGLADVEHLDQGHRKTLAEALQKGAGNENAFAGGVDSVLHFVDWLATNSIPGMRWLERQYGIEDKIAMLALYRGLRTGKGVNRAHSQNEALDIVSDLYNYERVAPWVKSRFGSRGLWSFASFTYKMAGALPRFAMTRGMLGWRPKSALGAAISTGWNLSKYYLIASGVHGLAKMATGLDDDEYSNLQDANAGAIDSWRRHLQVPILVDPTAKNPEDRVVFWDMSGVIPLYQLRRMFDAGPGAKRKPLIPRTAQQILRLNVLGQPVGATTTGEDYFGRELEDAGDWAYEVLARPLLPGAVMNLTSAGARMERHGAGFGLARTFGVKIGKSTMTKYLDTLYQEGFGADEDSPLRYIRTPMIQNAEGYYLTQMHQLVELMRQAESGDFEVPQVGADWLLREMGIDPESLQSR